MLRLFLLVLALGCASTSRTKYEPLDKKHGYEDKALDGNLRMASFKANAYTNKQDAELFAKFRAIEICHGTDSKLAHILSVEDKTVSKEVLHTSGTGFPSYYYGMSPYYGRFHSGISIGYSHMSTSTYPETYSYPHFEVVFECVKEAYGPELVFREVSREEMKLLVRDLKGALQVEEVMKNSPNQGVLEVGDVILKVQGIRIERVLDLTKRFSANNRQVTVDFMREGKRRKAIMRSDDVTGLVQKSQEEIIRRACGKKEIKERSICK